MYKIDNTVDLERLVDCLDDALNKSTSSCIYLLKDTTENIVRDAKRNIERNGNINTGRLKNSITYKIISKGSASSTTATIRVGASHGIFIEEGTRPHVIRAKYANALRFEVGGEVIYAKEVRHPGTKANPFLKPAFEKHSKKFIKGLEDIANGNY